MISTYHLETSLFAPRQLSFVSKKHTFICTLSYISSKRETAKLPIIKHWYVWILLRSTCTRLMEMYLPIGSSNIKSTFSPLALSTRPHHHYDVIKWKCFPRYWSFVSGIHRSLVNSPHKGKWRGALMFSLNCALNKQLSEQSWGWWFETPLRSLWRHCNDCSIKYELPWAPFTNMD